MFFAVWKIAFESQFGTNDLIDKKHWLEYINWYGWKTKEGVIRKSDVINDFKN